MNVEVNPNETDCQFSSWFRSKVISNFIMTKDVKSHFGSDLNIIIIHFEGFTRTKKGSA